MRSDSVQLALTGITRQVSRTFDLNLIVLRRQDTACGDPSGDYHISRKVILLPFRFLPARCMNRSLLLDHLKFQIIKIDRFNKTVLRKPRLIMQLKVADIRVEPDWLA